MGLGCGLGPGRDVELGWDLGPGLPPAPSRDSDPPDSGSGFVLPMYPCLLEMLLFPWVKRDHRSFMCSHFSFLVAYIS